MGRNGSWRGVLRQRGGDLREWRREVDREAEMSESSCSVRTRVRGTMGVAVTILAAAALFSRIRIVRVLQRVRECFRPIAGARSPRVGDLRRLGSVLMLLAVMLLGVQERHHHETEDRDRGKELSPV